MVSEYVEKRGEKKGQVAYAMSVELQGIHEAKKTFEGLYEQHNCKDFE